MQVLDITTKIKIMSSVHKAPEKRLDKPFRPHPTLLISYKNRTEPQL